MKAIYDELLSQREDLNYEIDGMVIKVDDFEQRERLGTRQRIPRWAIAWKFPPRKEVTILHDIAVQVGRTGKLTPIALLEPVDVGGVTISRASLHNAHEVHRLDVRPGDTVRIARAGDVIPHILERVERSTAEGRPFTMPERCPLCDTEIIQVGAYHICPAGLSCPAQLKAHIHHYGSRSALDIDGLGEKTVDALVEANMVRDIADLYHLKVDDLLSLERFAEKSAQSLVNEIQQTTSPELSRFLYALGIHHVGERTATVFADAFGSLSALMQADVEELEKIHEIGPETARSVAQFFQDEKNCHIIEKLHNAGLEVQTHRADDGGQRLIEKTFVFTGALDGFTRDEAARQVQARGGRITSSISGQSNYLVVGNQPGSKLDAAREKGVEILDEAAFKELLN